MGKPCPKELGDDVVRLANRATHRSLGWVAGAVRSYELLSMIGVVWPVSTLPDAQGTSAAGIQLSRRRAGQ